MNHEKHTQKENQMNTIKNKAGVYRITNTENGKRYYGSSKTLRHRWSTHKSDMRLGKHNNPGIREDAAVYGEEAFEFEVLCYCKPEDRKRLEGAVIDQNYGKDCYNDTNGDGTLSEEHRANLSAAKKGENNPMYGKTHTEEAKAKISENHVGMLGKTHTEETKAKISEVHAGKTVSEETKANISATMKGKTHPKTTCPHCGLTGGSRAMKRWHFDNCEQKPL